MWVGPGVYWLYLIAWYSLMRYGLQIVVSFVLLASYGASGILLEVAHHHRGVMGGEKRVSAVVLADRTVGSPAPSHGETPCSLCFLVAQQKCTDPPQFSGAPPALGCITNTTPTDTSLPHFSLK